MKLYAKSISVFIVALFLGSFAATVATNPSEILEEENRIMNAPTSPGHPI